MYFRLLRYGDGMGLRFHLSWNIMIIRWFIKNYQPHAVIFQSALLPSREYYDELFKNLPPTEIILYKSDQFPVPHCSEITRVVYLSKNLKKPLIHQMGFPAEKLIHIPILFKPPVLKGKQTGHPVHSFKYILYLGALYPLKGVHRLIKAFELLKEEYPALRLVVAGPVHDGLCYDHRVILSKPKNRSEVYRYIKNAELVVIPSYSEGLPRVALETLHFKKPLLITGVVEETRHFPAHQVLEKIEPGEIAGKVRTILQGAPVSCQFNWEDLDFKRVEARWNRLIDEIPPAETEPAGTSDYPRMERLVKEFVEPSFSSPGESKNPLLEIWERAGKDTADPDKSGHIAHVYFLNHLTASNWEERLAGIAGYPWLMNGEKKELLKQMLDKLSSRFNIFPAPGDIHKFFFSLPPFTAHDYLFMGQLMLKQKAPDQAKEYLTMGLDEYPEITRFKIFRLLLTDAGLSGFMEPGEKEALNRRFARWLKRVPPGDVITLLDEPGLDFLAEYTDVEALLEGELEKIEKIGDRPGKSGKSRKDPDRYFKLLYLMGTWRKKQGADNFTVYYRKAVRILRRKKNQTPRERYRLASLEKQLRNYSRATEMFQSFISGTAGGVSRSMAAGAFFHLGEMALEKPGMKDAENYFLKCLESGGDHARAREYLSKLEK